MAKTPWHTYSTWGIEGRVLRGADIPNKTNEQLTAFAAYLRDHPMAHNPACIFHKSIYWTG